MTEIATIEKGFDSLRMLMKETASYGPEADYFLNYCESENLGILEGIIPYLRTLEESGFIENGQVKMYSANTLNKRMNAAKTTLRVGFKRSEEYLDPQKRQQFDDIMAEIKNYKIASVAVNPDSLPDPEDIAILLNSEKVNIRVRLVVLFLSMTGCRIGETLAIRNSDIKRVGREYQVRLRGKGRKERKVPVATELVDRIQKEFAGKTFLFEHNGKQFNQFSMTTRIRAAGEKVLGRNMHGHTLRHYYATQQRLAGVQLEALSRHLGHSSVAITGDLYSHVGMKAEIAILRPAGVNIQWL